MRLLQCAGELLIQRRFPRRTENLPFRRASAGAGSSSWAAGRGRVRGSPSWTTPGATSTTAAHARRSRALRASEERITGLRRRNTGATGATLRRALLPRTAAETSSGRVRPGLARAVYWQKALLGGDSPPREAEPRGMTMKRVLKGSRFPQSVPLLREAARASGLRVPLADAVPHGQRGAVYSPLGSTSQNASRVTRNRTSDASIERISSVPGPIDPPPPPHSSDPGAWGSPVTLIPL